MPFASPDSLRVTVSLPHAGTVSGMGIPTGVTLVVGGGYHSKSTLLLALERGVYNHVPGDGRERVVTDPTAVKIRAEDGRRIEGVDVRPFIDRLPDGSEAARFRTANASGSTSQAANILEAMEVGAKLLLLDEDTSATNFMVRDVRMQALVSKANEPITKVVLSKESGNNFVATVNMESAVSLQKFSARESSDDIYFAIFNVFKKLKTKLDHYKIEKRKKMLSLC